MSVLPSWMKRLIFGRRKPVILLYHRVVSLSSDSQALCVTPAHFEEQLALLRREYEVLSLRELCGALETGTLPEASVVITFDDGYYDNLYIAKPLLEKYEAPATVFVTSGQHAANREFWWDELEALLIESTSLPDELVVKIQAERFRFIGLQTRPERKWNVLMASDPTPRHTAYRKLAPALKQCPAPERDAVLNQLSHWAGSPRKVRPSHRPMSPDELRDLATGDLLELGAHTVTHSTLSLQPIAEQRYEVAESKRSIELALDRKCDFFSYPYGTQHDYAHVTADLVKEEGFRAACSNFEAQFTARTNPYELPRFLVRDWNGDEFQKRVECWKNR